MRRALIAVSVVLVMACGSSPTAPVPVPTANIVSPANSSLTLTCPATGQCSFQGQAVNTGDGCAVNVRGTTRLMDSNNIEISRLDWSLPATQTVRPGASFGYESCCFLRANVDASVGNRTAFTWDDAKC